jgi:hypothetical protein
LKINGKENKIYIKKRKSFLCHGPISPHPGPTTSSPQPISTFTARPSTPTCSVASRRAPLTRISTTRTQLTVKRAHRSAPMLFLSRASRQPPLLSICLSTPLTRGPRLSGSSPRCRCNRNADYLAGNLVPRAPARSSLLGYKSGVAVSSSSPDPALFRPVIPTAKSSSAMPLPFAQIRSRASPLDCALQ